VYAMTCWAEARQLNNHFERWNRDAWMELSAAETKQEDLASLELTDFEEFIATLNSDDITTVHRLLLQGMDATEGAVVPRRTVVEEEEEEKDDDEEDDVQDSEELEPSVKFGRFRQARMRVLRSLLETRHTTWTVQWRAQMMPLLIRDLSRLTSKFLAIPLARQVTEDDLDEDDEDVDLDDEDISIQINVTDAFFSDRSEAFLLAANVAAAATPANSTAIEHWNSFLLQEQLDYDSNESSDVDSEEEEEEEEEEEKEREEKEEPLSKRPRVEGGTARSSSSRAATRKRKT